MATNNLHPGKPNYTGPATGYFTLLHHKGPLAEWSSDVSERIRYIKTEKATAEIPVRLRHIVYVPGKMIPKILQKADADWQKADADRRKADADWQKADAEKLTAYLRKHVKNCAWNGHEIVFSDGTEKL